ncbi:MAG: tetratricopeptide repeat protein [Methylococcales bacterium]
MNGYISGVGITSSSAERYLEKIQRTFHIGIKDSTIGITLAQSDKLLKSYLRERPNSAALDPIKAVNPKDKKPPVHDYLSDDEIERFYSGDRSKAYYEQGTFLYERRAYAEAEANFRKAIELNPKFPWAFCNLAVLLDEQGRHSEALELIDGAISLDPHDSDFPERRREILENLRPGTPKADTNAESERLCREATVHFQSGRYQQALNCIEQALSMDESRLGRDSMVVAAHFKNRGMSLISLQRYKEAIDSYTTALSIFRQVEGPSGSQVAICLTHLCGLLIAKLLIVRLRTKMLGK